MTSERNGNSSTNLNHPIELTSSDCGTSNTHHQRQPSLPPFTFPSRTAMPHTLNFVSAPPSEILSLSNIRTVLQRLEDTIVFQLIERAQFAHNPKMYQIGAFPELKQREGWEGTWTEWFLKENEVTHAKCRRWQAPDEYPFTKQELLPEPIIPPVEYPTLLQPKEHGINVNDKIFQFYTEQIVPAITRRFGEGGDDGQYGSAAVRDVEVLSALSRRIHFGMFVSEAKFLSDPPAFIPHILQRNGGAVLDLITKPAVEEALFVRLAEKARVYGQDMDSAGVGPSGKAGQGHGALTARERQDVEAARKIEVDEVVRLYRQFVIPLTKEVEVEYLFGRLRELSEAQVKELQEGKGSAA